MSIIDRLLVEAEKAQRKGHLLLAEVCRDAADELGLVIEERNRLREALKELLGMVDWLHSAHAQGKDVPFICTQIAPAAVKGWAALEETGHE